MREGEECEAPACGRATSSGPVVRDAVRRGLMGVLLVCVVAAMVPSQGTAQEGTRIRYVDAELHDVIRGLGNMMQMNILISEGVPTERITYTTAGPVARDELGSVFESLLESHDLVLVDRGAVAEVMPAEAAPATGPVYVGQELPQGRRLGLITQLVPLRFLRPGEAIATLEALASPLARIEPAPRSNAILITDRAVNVERYLELLRTLDVEREGTGGLRTYVYRLEHATASQLAVTLARVFGVEVPAGEGMTRAEALRGRSLSGSLRQFREQELQSVQMRRELGRRALGELPRMPEAQPQRAPADTSPEGRERGEEELVGRTTVVPDPSTNSLVIRTAPPNYAVLEQTIRDLDVRPAQVLLEVLIAEITLDRSIEYGIDWSFFTELDDDDSLTGRLGPQQFSDDDLDGVDDFLLRAISLGDVNIRSVLRLLSTMAEVNVVSTPHVLALNNEEARILVGSEVPFTSSSRAGLDVVVDRVVQFRNVGTELTVIPTINEDRYVTFRVLQEVSNLTEQTLESALGAPIISIREAETSALVRDGQTVVIGGLISEDVQTVESGIPVLKDIPLLGLLFGSSRERRQRTELAIFITPRVVTSDLESQEVLERERERLREEVFPPLYRESLPSPDTVSIGGGPEMEDADGSM